MCRDFCVKDSSSGVLVEQQDGETTRKSWGAVLLGSAQADFPEAGMVGPAAAGLLFGRGNPSPNPLGLCTARMGSASPLPSRPRPEPGVHPILWSIRFPMLFSEMGWAFSPTNPEIVK